MILQQNADSLRRAAEAAFAHSLDSLSIVKAQRAHAIYDSALASAVERANSSGTWMGVYIGALGGLFAIGAIVSGFLIYRQGADYRRRLTEVIAELKGQAGQAAASMQAQVEAYIDQNAKEFELLRATYSSQIDTLRFQAQTATEESKKQIDAEIEGLRKALEALPQPNFVPPFRRTVIARPDEATLRKARDAAAAATVPVANPATKAGTLLSGLRKCPHCDKFFNLPETQPGMFWDLRAVECPNCHERVDV
jgi:hypothetical protein